MNKTTTAKKSTEAAEKNEIHSLMADGMVLRKRVIPRELQLYIFMAYNNGCSFLSENKCECISLISFFVCLHPCCCEIDGSKCI